MSSVHGLMNGQTMDQISDNVDNLNRLHAEVHHRADERSPGAPRFDEEKDKTAFRNYEEAKEHVKEFYREQHLKQTVEYNKMVRQKMEDKEPVFMTVWEAMVQLDKYVDQSDPDTEVTQIEHLLQTAEAMRKDNQSREMQVVGLVHDLGKLLSIFGAQGQWDVVGDTFPVGCEFSEKIKLYDSLKENPDYHNPAYNTKFGIYSEGCGLDNLMMSYGHDEYLYQVVKDQSTLSADALAMIRYHSFYPWHNDGQYKYFMNEDDENKLAAVKKFNPYDLYSKSDEPPKVEELKPYYLELIAEFFPKGKLAW